MRRILDLTDCERFDCVTVLFEGDDAILAGGTIEGGTFYGISVGGYFTTLRSYRRWWHARPRLQSTRRRSAKRMRLVSSDQPDG